MSRFPDFMHTDLTKLTCGGCLLVLLSVLVACGAAIGGILLMALAPAFSPQARPGRWMVVVLVLGGLAVGAGFYQLGRFLMRRLGLRMYREGHAPPEDLEV